MYTQCCAKRVLHSRAVSPDGAIRNLMKWMQTALA